jgi:FkbM family methyltransferase
MSIRRLLKSVVRDLLPYAGLDFHTPSGLHLYVPDRGAWSSAGEIFFSRGYEPFYKHLNGVRHWVDLGCNQGFFSFGLLDYLARREGRPPDTRVFLGDANEDCVARVRAAIKHNGLQSGWRCERVVVGPRNATVRFQQHKDSIHSNIFARGRGRKIVHLPTTDLSLMLAHEPRSFDLVKIDIEGAEKFLFHHHLDFLKQFRYGLCEWHTPIFSGPDLANSLRHSNWQVVELYSSGVEYDQRRGNTWESPQGTVLWENPNPLH